MSGGPNFQVDRSRETAHQVARDGVALLARAFNHLNADEVPYRYANGVQGRFLEIGIELVRLIEHGAIEPNPAHVQYLQLQAARADASVQRVLQEAVCKVRHYEPMAKGRRP